MTKDQYIEEFEKFTAKMLLTTKAKNHDYTGGDPDPFYNFTRARDNNICPVETGILVRMSDKMSRIIGLINGNPAQVKEESVIDTLLDLANYSIILAVYRKSLQKNEPHILPELQK